MAIACCGVSNGSPEEREKTSKVCVYMYIKVFILETGSCITEAGKSKICRLTWQAGNPERSQCWSSSVVAVRL